MTITFLLGHLITSRQVLLGIWKSSLIHSRLGQIFIENLFLLFCFLSSLVVCEFYRNNVKEYGQIQKRNRICSCSLDGNTITIQSNIGAQYIGVTIYHPFSWPFKILQLLLVPKFDSKLSFLPLLKPVVLGGRP